MVEPVPEEIEQEIKDVTARGVPDVHVNVLTRQSVEAYALKAGFRLTRTMEDLLERTSSISSRESDLTVPPVTIRCIGHR